MWQDLILMWVGLIFTITLIPQLMDAILDKASLNFWTCFITGVGCLVIGCVYLTLNLPYAAVVSFATGCMWLLLMYYGTQKRVCDDIENNCVN